MRTPPVRPLQGVRRRFLPAVLAAWVTTSCNWVSTAKNALTYPTVQRGEAANLAVLDTLIYATQAEAGLVIVGIRSGRTLATLAPPAGSESIDDIAIAGSLLFVLDARAPGRVSAYSLADPLHPRLVSPPQEAPVGPFSGVSASGGLCVVSGGTSALTAWRYDAAGALTGPIATADLGRGQPDVLVAQAGRRLYVSTHYRGPYFGLDIVGVDSVTQRLEQLAELPLEGAGFTAGGSKPANFPMAVAALNGDTVLVAAGRGVAVIDATVPRQPRLTQTIDVGGPAVSVAAERGVAVVAVAGLHPALVVLDFSGTEPRVAKRIPLAAGTLPAGVALTPGHAVVAARDRGVLVYDR